MKKTYSKWLLLLFCIGILVSVMGSCRDINDNSKVEVQQKGKLVIGSKGFTEQIILSKITAIYLFENGYDVEEVNGMPSTVVRSAIENEKIDICWEYTGTGLTIYNKQPKQIDPEITYQKVKKLDEARGLIWLERANFQNPYTILMRNEEAKEKGIKTLSDLADYVNKNPGDLIFGSNAEFYAREDGIKGLEKKYDFQFSSNNVIKMDTGLTYISLKEKAIDVAMGFATDGRVAGFNLVTLEDDKKFFPPYHAAPVVREGVLRKNIEIEKLLKDISSRLDLEEIMKLNYYVDVENENVIVVARDWLVEHELLCD